MLYGYTCDYHWDQFDKNASNKDILGDWEPEQGLGQGPFGFGKAVSLGDEQCMYDTDWAKPDPDSELDYDPCMANPMNCSNGISFSVWEQMMYSADVLDISGVGQKKYIMSTGGDANSRTGKSWPGIAIFHQGLDIVALVSTGTKVWELRVSGQLYNNTWTEIGIRFTFPDLSNPKWALMEEAGLEKMGGLEMYINLEKVGHMILPQSTDRGSTTWTPMQALTHNGFPAPNGQPVLMVGCHQNSQMQMHGEFSGFAGTNEAPALFDEVAIWKHRLEPYEIAFFLGGYAADFEEINADQFSAMLGNVDLDDPEQAGAAQAVLEAMLMGPPTTLPPFPTRTPLPTTSTTTRSTTLADGQTAASTKSTTQEPTTTIPPEDTAGKRKTMLSRQSIMSTMLMAGNTPDVEDGQDPEEVEGRFAISVVASALLSGSRDNEERWAAVHEEAEHEGPQKTVKELEEYMLAWVGSVNTSASRPETKNWRTDYFDSTQDSMRYATHAEDFVLNVDKLPFESIRDGGAVRIQYPDYEGWEWEEAKSMWENPKDNFSVPTGMYKDIPGCDDKPITILTAVYNGLSSISSPRRNPVSIQSENFFIDSKVISVRTKMGSDPMVGDQTAVYHCLPDPEYMKWNPIRLMMFHKQPTKAKRTLLWHSDDYWKGLEVRHCVWWNERFGTNGAWDTTGCKMTATNEEISSCECSQFGSYAVLSEMLQAPDPDDNAMWILAIKWLGIIIGTILLTIFIGVVFVSVVVGEMFHQLRMYTCLAYLIGNIFMLVGDTSVCDNRHNNMAISMILMYFFQAAICWNMCETHATFKGITSGLINGRTSVYMPIAWGLPLICTGFLCFMYGELLGTHPNCFISWENEAVEKYFFFNAIIFCWTTWFSIVIIFNMMRVQSHNKETIEYLRDQVKGLLVTSALMMILWLPIGWFSYIKNPARNLPSMMPIFQILNGWFGVILFLCLGMWSKRFRVGLNDQAEEKKRILEEKKRKAMGEETNGRAADTDPLGSPEDGKSIAGAPSSPSSRPPDDAEEAPPTSSRPATAGATGTSRPTSAASFSPNQDATGDSPLVEEAIP